MKLPRQRIGFTGEVTLTALPVATLELSSEDYVIGDSLRDLSPGVAVGARPILVLTGKGQITQRDNVLPEGTRVCADLAEAVEYILKS